MMDGRVRAVSLCVVASVLAGCAIRHHTVVVESADGRAPAVLPAVTGEVRGHLSGDHYIVGKGDTLYSIAFKNGVDFRTLAAWNGIAEPYRIWPGQSLRLTAPAGAAVAPAPAPAPAPAATTFTAAPVKPVKPVAAAPVVAPVVAAVPAASPVVATAPAASHASTVVNPAPVSPKPALPASVAPAVAPPVVATPAAAVANNASRNSGGILWRWPATGPLIKRYQASEPIPGIEIAGKAGDPIRAAADGVVVYSGNGLVGYGELIIIKHSDALLSAYGHNSKRLVKEGQTVKSGQKIAEMGSSGASRVELQFQVRRDGNPVDPMAYLPPQS